MQQVRAVSAAINNGYLLKPYIVKYISEPDTNSIILENKKTVIDKVISDETSSMVRYALESVVANGSGHNAYIENYRVGGKTGTAQKVEDGKYLSGDYIVSFMGFMPADNPEIVLYVAINHPRGVIQYGGVVAAPIAKNILKEAINIFNFKEDVNGMIKTYTWNETKYTYLNDVVNMDKKDAIKKLKGFKIEYSGYGDTVIYMEPEANRYVKEGSTVKLLLN